MIFIMNINLMMFTTIMLFIEHPLSMGLMILLQTFIICILSSSFLFTYWFSYILFLTFLGGLLVLFIYTSTIASNELFKFSTKMLMFLGMTIMISIFFLLIMNNKINFNLLNLETKMINEMFIFMNNENKMNLNKLYNNQIYLMMMMLITYLLITLIAVVKITNNIFGPLRLMN